jgi:hypothetical protein
VFCIIEGAIYCVVYQHRRCDICAVSYEVRYTVWCISIGGAICCVLYQRWGCDMLSAVSA